MAIDLPADPHAHPRLLVAGAVERFGRAAVVRWCEDLLAGAVWTDAPDVPRIEWLGGTDDWPEHWGRTWGARGLLHAGGPDRPAVVLTALDDPQWRVREMALKVIRTHRLDDPDGRVPALLDDPVERVRTQVSKVLRAELDDAS